MPRLPLAPPLRPDEALSSWVARIAARYDLSAFDLVRHLLPKADDVAEMLHWLDYRPVAPLEAALPRIRDTLTELNANRADLLAMHARCKRLLDGRGAQRIAAELAALCHAGASPREEALCESV